MDEGIDESSGSRRDVLVVEQAAVPEPLPELIRACGGAATFAWEEFIYGRLRNPGTRRQYRLAVERFLAWCGHQGTELVRIAPAHVGRYLDDLPVAPATKKLHLAALRHFFDELVLRHVMILNPAASVRGERLQAIEGKTPEITVQQARRLLASIETSHVIGLRDRAIIAVMIYTAARVGAVARLRRGDFYDAGDQHCLRFTE
jgi:site-specific recombinase XerD